jgi:cation diffusion facilitator CzcD-associated flavoprotein CzcO
VDGRVLGEEWDAGGIEAHRGTMVAGYPNLFFLLGPNTGLGHNSVVFMAECQIRLAAQAMELARRRGAAVAPNTNYLFYQFFEPPVSVGMASIPELTLYRGFTSLPMSHDLPFRPRLQDY